MRVPFRVLPGTIADVPRPLIDVGMAGLEETALTCLLDTGTLLNRFAGWVAREAGLDLSGVDPESIGVGGRPLLARTAIVELRLGRHAWEAPVSFCDPWPWDFQLLGQEGFLRFFRIVLQAADGWLEVTVSGPASPPGRGIVH